MRTFSTIFIDLDQTLYPASSEIWEDVIENIHVFLQEELGLSPQEAIDLRLHYLHKYGATLRGLQLEAKIDPFSYMNFIHNVAVEKKIQVDPMLPELFRAIRIPKYIFTNASLEHAERVLKHLGIEDSVDGIIDIIRLGFINKPDPLAFQQAIEIAGSPDPQSCVLIDDRMINLEAGARLGMVTVHVGTNRDDKFIPDHQISSILALLDVLPELKVPQTNSGLRNG
jgi:putative hydrolase of the HAD superfamily